MLDRHATPEGVAYQDIVTFDFCFDEAGHEGFHFGDAAKRRPGRSRSSRKIDRVAFTSGHRVEKPIVDVMIVGCAVHADQGRPPAPLMSKGDGATVDLSRLYHRAISSEALASPIAWKRKKRSRAYVPVYSSASSSKETVRRNR